MSFLSFFNPKYLFPTYPSIPFRNLGSASAVVLTSLFVAGTGFAQSVQIDGTTATTVTLNPSGQITVGIAPANPNAVSHNTYTQFSVTGAGVNLDNTTAGARTIVNEVTSTAPSLIEGPLTVIGEKAHVILANPNGITVNGGRFVNTGNVGLTTGTIGYDGNGRAITSTSTGRITVGAGGLSGTMEELDLIAAAIRLNGQISHDNPDAASRVNIVAGSSRVRFDETFGGTGVLPWGLTIDRGNTATDQVIVDITPAGSISSGRISITVTDQGAGVRIAADQLATSGGFRLSNSGKLEIASAKINAVGSVNVRSGSIDIVSTPDARSEVLSLESGVVLETTLGGIDLGSSRISGKTVASDNLASSGGITLISNADILSLGSGDQHAELISQDSSVALFADDGIKFTFGDLTAEEDIRFSAGEGISFSKVKATSTGAFGLFTAQTAEFDETMVKAETNITLQAGSLRFGSLDETDERSEFIAKGGGFVLRSTSGDILNYGSLLQGRVANAADVSSLGGFSLYSAGDFVNRSLSVDHLAVAFGELGDLHIETAGDVLNETGRLFSNGGINISATGDVLNDTGFDAVIQPLETSRSKGGRFALSAWLKRERNTYVRANYGKRRIKGEQALILGVGDVHISAANITNYGGDITGGSLALQTPGILRNEARLTGEINYRLRCRWRCRSFGSSTLTSVGGTLNATNELAIDADTSVENIAGRMTAGKDITITTPLLDMQPILFPTLVENRASFFRGRRSWVSMGYSFGNISSFDGKLTIDGDVRARDEGLGSPEEIEISGTRLSMPDYNSPSGVGREPIGLIWSLF